MMAKINPAPLLDRVNSIRQQITETRAAQRTLAVQKRSRDEVAAHFIQRIDEWERVGNVEVSQAVQECAKGLPADLLMIRGTGMQTLGPLFAIIAAEALRATVARHVEALPAGMSTVQRMAEIEKKATRLRKLETEEESLIRESEAAQEPIDRRPDADPAIVLARTGSTEF